jgi:hypothetical protein
VLLTLGVENWDPNLTKAKTQNDQIIQDVLQIADSFVIDPKHVQTDYVLIEPSYENYERHRITGYYVRKTVEIRLKDVSKFEALLSQALEAGVNYVQRVEFRTSELRKHRDQARALAIEAAQEKAAAMAEKLDQQIGQPLAVTENWSQWWYPYNSWWGFGGGASGAQNVVQNAGGTSPTTDGNTALGQISVSASVTVQFELK